MKADHLTQTHLIEHRGFSRSPTIGQHGELIADVNELVVYKALVRKCREGRDRS